MLDRGEIFSVMNKMHRNEMIHVFNLFFYSKDWTTFYKNVIWARMNINEGMFVYALTLTVLHRRDMIGVILPPLYEICPYMFFSGEVIHDVIWNKDLTKSNIEGGVNNYDFMMNNVTHWNKYKLNHESKLTYFTEDIGLNSYYYYFNMDYPFWMGGKDYELYKDRRGEQYLYFHQQLLARYYLERLTNGMGEIDDFDWQRPIKTGYFSGLRYYNGVNFPVRGNDYTILNGNTKNYYLMDMVMDFERRIRDVIDSGRLITDDNKIIDIRDYKGIDYLGNLIHGNPDNVNNKFYRYVIVFARFLLGGSYFDNFNNYHVLPSVLEHYETTMRDPVFYQLYKRLIRYYWRFKGHLDSYTRDDLMLNDLKINDVMIGNLYTYFDYFDVDITNAVNINYMNKLTRDYDGHWDGKKDYLKDTDYIKHKDYDYLNKHKDIDYLNKFKDYDVHRDLFKDDDIKHKDYINKHDKDFYKGTTDYDKFKDYDYIKHKDFDYNKHKDIHRVDTDFGVNTDDILLDKSHTDGHYKNWMTTNYDDYYRGIMNHDVLGTSDVKKVSNVVHTLYKARSMRLNHQPFTLSLDVTTVRPMKVVVRMFMGPKYDTYGFKINLNENRKNFVEIDKFVYDLTVGKNIIKRTSQQFYYSVRDRTTYSELYKRVMMALEGSSKFQLDMSEAHCGFPDRLLLPKGTLGGYPMQFFFIINEFKDTESRFTTYDTTLSCGVGTGARYFDNLPLGYPFDRRINEHYFYTRNMFFKDVVIYHKVGDTVNNYVRV